MKAVVGLFICAVAVLIAASYARTLLSHERAIFAATVTAYQEATDNAVREQPLPGEITAMLSDGRTVRLLLNTPDAIKPGAPVRISERVAPWGETWFQLIE